MNLQKVSLASPLARKYIPSAGPEKPTPPDKPTPPEGPTNHFAESATSWKRDALLGLGNVGAAFLPPQLATGTGLAFAGASIITGLGELGEAPDKLQAFNGSMHIASGILTGLTVAVQGSGMGVFFMGANLALLAIKGSVNHPGNVASLVGHETLQLVKDTGQTIADGAKFLVGGKKPE